MSEMDNRDNFWLTTALVILVFFALAIIGFVAAALRLPITAIFGRLFNALLATSSVQALWYVTRAAGIMAYLLLWLSTVWGLAVSSKLFDPLLQRFFTYDMHQFISLLALGFIALHIVVLLADRYLPFSIAQVLVPFIAPYRPVWVGIGIIGFYLTLLVSATFYIRQHIGYKTFHLIHYASLIAYITALIHGLQAGTDSPLPAVQIIYAVTALVVVFLFVYRMIMAMFPSRESRSA